MGAAGWLGAGAGPRLRSQSRPYLSMVNMWIGSRGKTDKQTNCKNNNVLVQVRSKNSSQWTIAEQSKQSNNQTKKISRTKKKSDKQTNRQWGIWCRPAYTLLNHSEVNTGGGIKKRQTIKAMYRWSLYQGQCINSWGHICNINWDDKQVLKQGK